jgi:hypothetical protein
LSVTCICFCPQYTVEIFIRVIKGNQCLTKCVVQPSWLLLLPKNECRQNYQQRLVIMMPLEHHECNPTVQHRLAIQIILITFQHNRKEAYHEWHIIMNKVDEGKRLSFFTVAENWQNAFSNNCPATIYYPK